MDLLSYQQIHEGQLLTSANFAYGRGDLPGAIGFLSAMAALLNIKLPQQPMPKPSQLDTVRALGPYYFRCLRLISAELGETIKNVRSSYAHPYSVTAATPAPPPKSAAPGAKATTGKDASK